MRQLIARIDDDLHVRLKERARAEGRSLNALVTELLESAVEDDTPRTRLAHRLDAAGMRVLPPRPKNVLPRDEAIARTRGWGSAVSEALEAERASR